MKIYYISDIHLEQYELEGYPLPTISSPNFLQKIRDYAPHSTCILVLAGDIGYPASSHFLDFIRDCVKYFHHIIYVSGNHEYYGFKNNYCMDEIENILISYDEQIEQFHYLQNEYLILEDIIFYGMTLWTHIPFNFIEEIENRMKDYRYINWTKSEKFKSNHTNELHSIAIEEFTQFCELRKKSPNLSSKTLIVVSHHCPTMNLHTGNRNDIFSYGYYSNSLSDDNINQSTYWIYGHTHVPADFQINNTRLLSNPHGYPGELNKPSDQIINLKCIDELGNILTQIH